MMGRTSRAPISARRLNVDKDQGLWSGLLSYTSCVLYPVIVYARIKVYFIFEINFTVAMV